MTSTITDRASGLGSSATPNGENATISVKVPVRVATTGNITLVGLQTIDGVTLVANDRVLVKDQTDQTENGIYLASSDAWLRTPDCADNGDLVTGTEVRVNEGSTNSGRWYCSSADPIVIGTSNITWAQVTGIIVADGVKGDVTVSSSASVWTVTQVTLGLLRGLTAAANKIPYFSAVDSAGLLDFKDEDDMSSNSASAVPSQQSVKAYVDASTGSSGSKIIRNWLPTDASFPASNYATLDTRNTHPVLDFATGTPETVYFRGVMPDNYAGEGITVELWWTATTETTGTVGWDVSLEKMDGLDIDSDNFATAQTVTAATVSATNGTIQSSSVNISDGANMASLSAGDLFRIRIRRDTATDTMANDAELHMVEMRIQ